MKRENYLTIYDILYHMYYNLLFVTFNLIGAEGLFVKA